MKRCQTLLVIAAFASSMYATEPSLKIYSGDVDTVKTATHTIVAVTNPGATAEINGQDVKVYKTGSFGAKVDLAEGDNTIDVKATLDGQTATRTLKIHRVAENHDVNVPKQESHAAESTFSTPFYVSSTPGAYLQYGNSNDRLGGSKMGFIDANIPLKIIGESGDLYKTQLSSNRFAFIPKEYTAAFSSPVNEAATTGSWSITNEGKSDRITIGLPGRQPYRYYTVLDPSQIVIEVFGAMDNSNWITQRTLDLGIIKYVDFNQVESDVYQVIINLKSQYQWGFTVHYEGNALVIDVRHRPEKLDLAHLTIGLDAGHGGEYPGAISPSGIKEKDVNLDIILRLKQLLEKSGAKVVLTREGDTGPSMAERKRIWREANVDLAISVHNNSGGSALSSPGTSTYYKHLFCRPLAESILNRVVETGLPLFGLVGNFNFSLNGPTDFPNALVEGMFMSSLEEEEKLADPQFRQLFAEKIFRGIQDYLKQVSR